MNRLTPAEILALPMEPNDADAATIRDYLVKLLAEVWKWGEGFDGKRPFGNSDWFYDLLIPLVKAGVIDGAFDEDGYLEDSDNDAGHELIAAAIKELGATQ